MIERQEPHEHFTHRSCIIDRIAAHRLSMCSNLGKAENGRIEPALRITVRAGLCL